MDLNIVDLSTSNEVDRKIRADALVTARRVIYGQTTYGVFSLSSAVADTVDVITVAKWIIDGRDPWPDAESDTFSKEELEKAGISGIDDLPTHVEPEKIYGKSEDE